MSDSFTFHGQTTFINRPVNTVIRDFQKEYLVGVSPNESRVLQEFSNLIELLLRSQDLPDDDKQQTVSAVHEAASQVKNQRQSMVTVRGILRAVKETASTAADIAAPAAALITSLLALLDALR